MGKSIDRKNIIYLNQLPGSHLFAPAALSFFQGPFFLYTSFLVFFFLQATPRPLTLWNHPSFFPIHLHWFRSLSSLVCCYLLQLSSLLGSFCLDCHLNFFICPFPPYYPFLLLILQRNESAKFPLKVNGRKQPPYLEGKALNLTSEGSNPCLWEDGACLFFPL